jgi:hypothetical protein
VNVKSWHASALTAVTLVALASSATAATDAPENDYSNQTPYGTPNASVQKAPDGYTMFFLETVGRHGARSLTNDGTERNVLKIWQQASDQGALTERGQTFARDVKRFQQAEKKIGYGKLSGLGKDEWKGIGHRDAEAYAPFFDSVKKHDEKIASLTTDVERTKQSAEAMHAGLTEVDADLAKRLEPTESADKLLHFGNSASSAGKAASEEIRSRDAIRKHAEDVLRTLYTPTFVDSIKDPVNAALDVYLLYSTAPGMAKETDITFARYVPQADREPLSYATDAKTFFQYGPGLEGEKNTTENARPLLDDFFKALDDRTGGGSTAAVFRFGHGETTMPFAALIKAPGGEQQVPKGERFTRDANPWRGATAGRLAGNIEWSAYRNDADKVLVTMRYHEIPVAFHDGCKPESDGSLFYTVTELKRCLG